MTTILRAILALVVSATVAAPAAAQNTQPWQSVHGQVQSVQGSQLTFKADDGRVLTVDMSQVDKSIQQALTAGEGVTVTGFPGASPTQMTAQYIQQDASDTSRGGTIAGQAPPSTSPPTSSTPSGSVDQTSWQRLTGTVQSVSGNTLTLTTSDNRTITVDIAQVSADIRNAVKQGETVTVAGFYQGDQNHVVAQYLDRSASQPAASPATK